MLQYKKGTGVYTFPASALVQVVLGAEIRAEDEERVRQWASEAGSKLSVVLASLSSRKFKVEVTGVWRRDT